MYTIWAMESPRTCSYPTSTSVTIRFLKAIWVEHTHINGLFEGVKIAILVIFASLYALLQVFEGMGINKVSLAFESPMTVTSRTPLRDNCSTEDFSVCTLYSQSLSTDAFWTWLNHWLSTLRAGAVQDTEFQFRLPWPIVAVLIVTTKLVTFFCIHGGFEIHRMILGSSHNNWSVRTNSKNAFLPDTVHRRNKIASPIY